MAKYRAGYADDNMEIFEADSDDKAFVEAWSYEKDHGQLFELDEINEDYDVIRSLL